MPSRLCQNLPFLHLLTSIEQCTFAKSQRDNLTPVQLAELKMVGRDLLALTEHQINEAVVAGQLQEVRYDEED